MSNALENASLFITSIETSCSASYSLTSFRIHSYGIGAMQTPTQEPAAAVQASPPALSKQAQRSGGNAIPAHAPPAATIEPQNFAAQ